MGEKENAARWPKPLAAQSQLENVRLYFFLAPQGLQGLQLCFFFAAQGLQGLQPPFFAAHGLQGLQPPFFAAQGLHGLQAASSMISWDVADLATASGRTLMAPTPVRAATPIAVTVFFNIFRLS
ncbi:MAG: hypothetical protein HQ512_01830 [Rhodospirillales bacterium]|nr:hypothetical protein [Rhodospirillales bacterium]